MDRHYTQVETQQRSQVAVSSPKSLLALSRKTRRGGGGNEKREDDDDEEQGGGGELESSNFSDIESIDWNVGDQVTAQQKAREKLVELQKRSQAQKCDRTRLKLDARPAFVSQFKQDAHRLQVRNTIATEFLPWNIQPVAFDRTSTKSLATAYGVLSEGDRAATASTSTSSRRRPFATNKFTVPTISASSAIEKERKRSQSPVDRHREIIQQQSQLSSFQMKKLMEKNAGGTSSSSSFPHIASAAAAAAITTMRTEDATFQLHDQQQQQQQQQGLILSSTALALPANNNDNEYQQPEQKPKKQYFTPNSQLPYHLIPKTHVFSNSFFEFTGILSRCGVPTGHGTLKLATGEVLEGEFLHGELTCKSNGVKRFPDGRIYEGGFERGEFNGQGRLVFPNGYFEGTFQAGAFKEGTLVDRNVAGGSGREEIRYVGSFDAQNRFHGKGVLYKRENKLLLQQQQQQQQNKKEVSSSAHSPSSSLYASTSSASFRRISPQVKKRRDTSQEDDDEEEKRRKSENENNDIYYTLSSDFVHGDAVNAEIEFLNGCSLIISSMKNPDKDNCAQFYSSATKILYLGQMKSVPTSSTTTSASAGIKIEGNNNNSNNKKKVYGFSSLPMRSQVPNTLSFSSIQVDGEREMYFNHPGRLAILRSRLDVFNEKEKERKASEKEQAKQQQQQATSPSPSNSNKEDRMTPRFSVTSPLSSPLSNSARSRRSDDSNSPVAHRITYSELAEFPWTGPQEADENASNKLAEHKPRDLFEWVLKNIAPQKFEKRKEASLNKKKSKQQQQQQVSVARRPSAALSSLSEGVPPPPTPEKQLHVKPFSRINIRLNVNSLNEEQQQQQQQQQILEDPINNASSNSVSSSPSSPSPSSSCDENRSAAGTLVKETGRRFILRVFRKIPRRVDEFDPQIEITPEKLIPEHFLLDCPSTSQSSSSSSSSWNLLCEHRQRQKQLQRNGDNGSSSNNNNKKKSTALPQLRNQEDLLDEEEKQQLQKSTLLSDFTPQDEYTLKESVAAFKKEFMLSESRTSTRKQSNKQSNSSTRKTTARQEVGGGKDKKKKNDRKKKQSKNSKEADDEFNNNNNDEEEEEFQDDEDDFYNDDDADEEFDQDEEEQDEHEQDEECVPQKWNQTRFTLRPSLRATCIDGNFNFDFAIFSTSITKNTQFVVEVEPLVEPSLVGSSKRSTTTTTGKVQLIPGDVKSSASLIPVPSTLRTKLLVTLLA